MANTNNINELISNAINAQFPKGTISTIDDYLKQEVEVFSTGSIALDKALGCNGIPKGRVIEIYGNESSGKTTIALQCCASVQKEGGHVAYIDLEHALDFKYCKANSINMSDMLVAHPNSAEQTFDLIESLIKTEMINLIVVDSVAAMIPEVELNGEMSDQTIGVHARIMSKGLRNIQPLMAKYNVTVIFINQIREKIGVMFGNNETTPGGRALRFYASIRMEIRRNELLKNNDEVIGIKTCVKIIKNKLGAPLTKTFVDIYFAKGYDPTLDIINYAIEKELIVKKGAWFFFEDNKIAQGKENTITYFLANPEQLNALKEKVNKI